MQPKDRSKFFRLKLREALIKVEEYLYYLVALGLILGFLLVVIDGLTLILSLYDFTKFSEVAIKFLDKILVSLIFLEIFYTVTVAITEESAVKCIEPFILVAITALVRRLIILSFEISHPAVLSAEKLKYFLIEMALVGLLIILMVLGLILFRRSKANGTKGKNFSN
ncbi:MAG: phosphate-starvation-inducible PsiE family protein [Caldimicrobium sp.]